MATRTEIAKLYVATFNRAADADGLAYWISDGTSATTVLTDINEIAIAMIASPEYSALYAGLDRENTVIAMYNNLFNRTVDATDAGVMYWTSGDGSTIPLNLMIQALINGADAADTATLDAKTEVGLYFADAGSNDVAAATSIMSGVTSDPTTVATAKAAVDTLVEPTGDTQYLTGTADVLAGTDAADTFVGDAAANPNGVIVNSLQTGDRIDGGNGTDTIKATILADGTFNNATAIRPIVENVEKVFINALAQEQDNDDDANFAEVASLVRLNADSIDGDMDEIWSNGSEASLRVENVANDGDTEDITIGMRETGNHGSLDDRQESNYEVYFEEIELTSGTNGQGGFFYDLINQASYDVSSAEAVKDFPLTDINFSVSFAGATAETFMLEFAAGDMDGILNHTQLVTLLNSKLAVLTASDARLSGFEFEVNGTFDDTDGRPSVERIQLTDNDPAGRTITAGSIGLDTTSGAGNLYWDQGLIDTVITNEPVTATVILDHVGRDSDGGYLRVGSMSEDTHDSQHGSTGIEVYDIEVQRDSSVSGLYTTNGTLDQILIKSAAGFSGDLEIGNTNTSPISGETIFDSGISLVRATGFNGDLSIGASSTANVSNLHVLDAVIDGDVAFSGDISGSDDIDAMTTFNYMTGAGNDTVVVNIDGDAVDAIGESLAINAASGDNKVTVSLEENVSYETMALLSNLDINTASGADMIENIGIGTFDITTGAGSDTVYINSIGDTNSATATKGHWEVGVDTGANQFVDRVLYEAKVVVNYAGFEQVVSLVTTAANNFVATQLDLNTAIKNAIDTNSELARLLKYTDSTAGRQLEIDALHEGANDLTIELYQPTLVVPTGTVTGDGSDVILSASHVSAVQAGLLKTTALTDSDDVDTAAEIVAQVNTTLNIDGYLDDTGAASTLGSGVVASTDTATNNDGDNETDVENYSNIDVQNGANDLIILNSDDGSTNTIEFSDTFGKVSIVNFFQTAGTVGGTDAGHILDFTHWLTDKTADSTSTISQVRIATTGTEESAAAMNLTTNEVAFINDFAETAGQQWANITAADVTTALNGGATYGNLAAGTTATLPANLVGTAQNSIILIGNDEANTNGNDDSFFDIATAAGEYKAYHIVDANGATAGGYTATFIGQVDFGAEVTAALGFDDDNVL